MPIGYRCVPVSCVLLSSLRLKPTGCPAVLVRRVIAVISGAVAPSPGIIPAAYLMMSMSASDLQGPDPVQTVLTQPSLLVVANQARSPFTPICHLSLEVSRRILTDSPLAM
ncbi:hypothetical protein DPEC_G00010110 [Dallia pectoralis]|uniref:Uncharacterized protein n=1 Tax=Dallia pectoralis TaxID=75939 RepID=A0ACC2HKZ4_DALPE|nr:hypothetical protein DPEC_G00010110 [Dallia pectoralis]